MYSAGMLSVARDCNYAKSRNTSASISSLRGTVLAAGIIQSVEGMVTASNDSFVRALGHGYHRSPVRAKYPDYPVLVLVQRVSWSGTG